MYSEAKQQFGALLNPVKIINIQALPVSGSNRQYFRVQSEYMSYIGTFSDQIQENQAFFYLSDHFKNMGLTPKLVVVSLDQRWYLQEDLGTVSLLDCVEQEGFSGGVYQLYQKTLQKLAFMQVKGDEGMDYSRCFSVQVFDYHAIISDLYYFKYCFLDLLDLTYNKRQLIEDFDRLAQYLIQSPYQYFMFRDFQSRNIQIKKGEPYFIDFQGAMKGSIQYDVASLLWQSRVNLPYVWREKLYENYVSYVAPLLETSIQDLTSFKQQYDAYVLIRMLQVLGAYGFRGLFEQKGLFLSSILPTIENLAYFSQNNKMTISLPALNDIINQIMQPEIKHKFA